MLQSVLNADVVQNAVHVVKCKMPEKKFWRWNVCSDIHYGVAGPEICPTCSTPKAYVEVTKEEAQKVMGL